MNEVEVVTVTIELDTPVRFSDGEYVSQASDAIGVVVFDPRLVGDVPFERSISWVTRGEQRVTNSLGAVIIDNRDGRYDYLIGSVAKGKRIEIRSGTRHTAFDAMLVEASAVIDRIEPVGERQLRLVSTSVLLGLNSPLVDAQYASGDSVPDNVIGKQKVVAIGHPKSCPVVLVNEVDYEFDCHFDSAWSDVSMVRDNGYPLPWSTGYLSSLPQARNGIELMNLPVGKIVADIRGVATAESIIGANPGDFPSGLTGWSVTTSGGGTVTSESGGCRLAGGDGTNAKIFISGALVAGATYRWSIASVTKTSGYGIIVLSGADGVRTITDSGTNLHGWFVADENAAFGIAKSGSAASVLIDGVRLERMTHINTIDQIVPWIIEQAGLDPSQVDTDSLAELAAACPYTLSYWADSSVRGRDVLFALLDSLCAYVYEDRQGRLAFGRPVPPESGSPVATIRAWQLSQGTDVQIRQDDAPGFSSIVAGGRNWHRYSEGDLADGVDDADVPLLTADYRYRATAVVATNAEVSNVIPAAQFGAGLLTSVSTSSAARPLSESGIGTCLDTQADCQDVADFLASLYPEGTPRRDADIDVHLDRATAALINPGAIVALEQDRFGLSPAQKRLVLAIKGAAGRRRYQLTLWG